jgi:tetratricopeptide (TPR) repeat protein
MGEVEYLFKHALTQEAAYESILFHKRKDLHIKVAHSIERVFSHRLHEFYGMLAYHYSRAECLAKAEEYLIKAGEEALKSSASNEALHYYQEALNLYLNKYGGAADSEKVAILEKNIALALYNRGQYDEAVEHFDRALNYYWGKFPKHAASAIFKLMSAFLHFLISLYLPSLKFRKIPTQKDAEIVALLYKKSKALAIVDPKKFFIEALCTYKEVTNFDLIRLDLGAEIFVGASALFSFTGISFRLSRRVLDTAKARVSKDNAKLQIWYEWLETLHNYFEGNWKAIKKHNNDLVNKNISLGEIYDASQHLYWHGFPYIYQGSLDVAEAMVIKLNNIFEVYNNDLSKSLKYELNTNLLIECRKLPDALIEVEGGIDFVEKAGLKHFLIEMYSCQAWIHIMMGYIKKAGESLQYANMIRCEIELVPFQLSNFYRSQLEYDLYLLKESISNGNKSEIFEYRKKAFKSSKMLLKVSRKVAQHRTESYKLTGMYYWLINKQKKALKSWRKAIEEGEHLGARLELSRAYFEVGKRLLEARSKYKMLNGIKAQEYLGKARVLFEEMDLQWDLDELDRMDRG